MKITTVAFSVLAVLSLAAFPMTAVAGCMGHDMGKVAQSTAPAPTSSASATETATQQVTSTTTPSAAPAPGNMVADLVQSDHSHPPKAE